MQTSLLNGALILGSQSETQRAVGAIVGSSACVPNPVEVKEVGGPVGARVYFKVVAKLTDAPNAASRLVIILTRISTILIQPKVHGGNRLRVLITCVGEFPLNG